MTPAATAAHGLTRGLGPSRFIINASSPVAANAPPVRRRRPSPVLSPGAQQHRRRYSYTVSADLPPPPISETFRRGSPEPVPEVSEAAPPPAPATRSHPDYAPFDVRQLGLSIEAIATRSKKTIQYKADLRAALRSGEVGNVVHCMYAGVQDAAFIRSIPQSTFTEMLRLVSSPTMANQLKEALEHTWWITTAMLPTRNAEMDKFLKAARLMIYIRRSAGVPVGLRDYKVLLNCAATAANRSAAIDFWSDLKKDSLEPDTECYNALMHAMVWDRRIDRSAGGFIAAPSFRVDGFYLRARRNGKLPYAPAGVVAGYASEVKSLFDELLRKGLIGDERTILGLMTAYARDGNLMGVKDTLKLVWGVDADEVVARGGWQKHEPRKFPAGAPLRPTTELLYTVVHTFGANSKVEEAIRVTDFISMSYELEITAKVWEELFTWAYVQSVPRSGRFKDEHRVPNPLPLETTERMWQALKDPQVNLRPTMKMFHLSINMLTRRQQHDAAVERIREGVQVYRQAVLEARGMRWQVAKARKYVAQDRQMDHSWYGLMMTLSAKEIVVKRGRAFIKRWCRFYLERGNGHGFWEQFMGEDGEVEKGRVLMYDVKPEWAQVDVPRFVEDFAEFCPTIVKYRMHTGVVELDLSALTPNRRIRNEMQKGFSQEVVETVLEKQKERKILATGGHRKEQPWSRVRFCASLNRQRRMAKARGR